MKRRRLFALSAESYLNPELLREKLRILGPQLLKPVWKALWTTEKPTTGYCYLVSEALHHYFLKNSIPYHVSTKAGSHWFLRAGSELYDWTADQFDFEVPYGLAKKQAFLKGKIKTSRGFISKNGFLLAKYLGLT